MERMQVARQGGMVFTLDSEVLLKRRAYHPLTDDLSQAIEALPVLRCLVIGRATPDVADGVGQLRFLMASDPQFPIGRDCCRPD